VEGKTFFATVAERAGLSKEEAADLTRATLEAIGSQISGGEAKRLAHSLPDWLAVSLPRHDRSADPMAVTRFISGLSRRTGLTEEESQRGVRAVLSVLRETVGPDDLDHALALLPKDYRELEAA
jgi:uncharacterized protein (DUF2267 family)